LICSTHSDSALSFETKSLELKLEATFWGYPRLANNDVQLLSIMAYHPLRLKKSPIKS